MGGIASKVPSMQKAVSETVDQQNIQNTAAKYSSYENPKQTYESASGRRASFASRRRRSLGSMGAMKLDQEGLTKDLSSQMMKKMLGE